MLQKIEAKFMTPEYEEAVRKAAVQDISARGEKITTEKSTQDGGPARTETYLNGQLISVDTKKGGHIDYYYDDTGRMIREVGPKRTIEYYYGKNGHLARSINTTTGSVSDYIYKEGALTSVKRLDLFRKPTFTEIQTDEFGRIIKESNKWETRTTVYDDVNMTVTKKCTAKIDPNFAGKSKTNDDYTEVFTYDVYGRVVSRVRDNKISRTFEYAGYIEKSETFKFGKKPAITNYTTINVTTAD